MTFLNSIQWKGMNLHASLERRIRSSPLCLKRSKEKKLAVLIPFRDRENHLVQLLPALHQHLKSACSTYRIFVVKQADQAPFNKGALLNAAVHCLEESWDYFCFHDVDFIPEKVDYRYCSIPLRPFSKTRGIKSYEKVLCQERLERLIKGDIDFEEKERLTVVYPYFWGGAILLPKEVFFKVNGFSNLFPSWGFEDLDFLIRLFVEGEMPHADPEGVFSLLPHIHSTQINDPIAMQNNLKHYEMHSKKGNFDKGFINVKFELIKKEHQETVTFLSVAIKEL